MKPSSIMTHRLIMTRNFIVFAMLILIVAACSNAGEGTPEVQPTLPPPPATMRMLFTPPEPLPEDQQLTVQLQYAILEETGLSVEIIPVDQSEAIRAICNNQGELPAIAWLNGLQLGFSEAQACGKPQLMVSRSSERADALTDISIDETAREAFESAQAMAVAMAVDETAEGDSEEGAEGEATPEATEAPTEEPTVEPTVEAEATEATADGETSDAEASDATTTDEDTANDDSTATEEAPAERADSGPTTGDTGLILFNPALETDTLDVISGAVYCRLGYEDDYSWLLPTLILQQNGLDIRSAGQIIDYPDLPLMVEAVANGDCTMTGVSARAFSMLDQELQDSVTVAPIETPEIPYAVLVYSPEIELGVRLALNRVFTQFAGNAGTRSLLDELVGLDNLVAVDDANFSELANFMRGTGVSFDGLAGAPIEEVTESEEDSGS